jgi:hypothetical protein
MKSSIVNQSAVNVGKVNKGERCWRNIRQSNCDTRTRVSSIPYTWSVIFVVSSNFSNNGNNTLLNTDSHSVGDNIWSSGNKTLRWR